MVEPGNSCLEHLPHNLNVKGLTPGTGRVKKAQNLFIELAANIRLDWKSLQGGLLYFPFQLAFPVRHKCIIVFKNYQNQYHGDTMQTQNP
jgi:hypothetical protein